MMCGQPGAVNLAAYLMIAVIGSTLTFATAAEKTMSEESLTDLDEMRQRVLAPYLTPPDAERVRSLRASMQEDGSWPDVNYGGSSTTTWEPAEHLRRLLILAQAWHAPTAETHGDDDLAAEISRALDCWLRKDPRRPWWWDCIGAPGRVSLILLMLDGHLTNAQRAKGIEILKRAKMSDSGGKQVWSGSETGQNLVWQAEITARRALLQKDAELLRRAFGRIASEIRISDGEGIQADFSFHQHGPCLYNHGYGANFATDNARLAALSDGTAFAYPPEKIALLSSYILDGSQWLARGPHTDFGAEGREITRPQQTARYLGEAARDMLKVATGRKAEFQALVARIDGVPGATPLAGNKHFYRSDIMAHHRPGWYMSARMYSTRTMNTDNLAGCGEGLLSHYLAEGATCIMCHGDEYLNLFPAWDWQRVPGTTVELIPHNPGEPQRKGASAFAGGASDGTAGVAAFQLQRETLRARKAWFFFSDTAVCLGAGIRCATDCSVVTTLNQCRLRGSVTIGSDTGAEVAQAGTKTIDARWIWHDGIAYLFEQVMPITLTNGRVEGNWRRISAHRSSEANYGILGSVTDQVFLVGMNHGVRPNGASYTYAVLPKTTARDVPALARTPPFLIATNSVNVQAVYHPGDAALGLVFHEPGRFVWHGWQLVVDRPCVLVLRQEQEVWHMALADPAAGSGTVRVDISWPNGRAHVVNVTLPKGQHVGKTTLVRLEQEASDRESR